MWRMSAATVTAQYNDSYISVQYVSLLVLYASNLSFDSMLMSLPKQRSHQGQEKMISISMYKVSRCIHPAQKSERMVIQVVHREASKRNKETNIHRWKKLLHPCFECYIKGKEKMRQSEMKRKTETQKHHLTCRFFCFSVYVFMQSEISTGELFALEAFPLHTDVEEGNAWCMEKDI